MLTLFQVRLSIFLNVIGSEVEHEDRSTTGFAKLPITFARPSSNGWRPEKGDPTRMSSWP